MTDAIHTVIKLGKRTESAVMIGFFAADVVQ